MRILCPELGQILVSASVVDWTQSSQLLLYVCPISPTQYNELNLYLYEAYKVGLDFVFPP